MTTMPRRIAAVFVLLALPAAALLAGAPPARAQGNPSFSLANAAARPIRDLFATPAGRTNWGQNRLAAPLAPGASLAVRLPADGNCLYDLRVVYADNAAEERRDVNTCETKQVAFGSTSAAAPRRFQLDNRGSVPIVKLEARRPGTTAWAPNDMAGGPIAPGSRRDFSLPPEGGCQFDLRVTFADGRAREKNAADLCRAPVQAVN